jgi:hypothetical protein
MNMNLYPHLDIQGRKNFIFPRQILGKSFTYQNTYFLRKCFAEFIIFSETGNVFFKSRLTHFVWINLNVKNFEVSLSITNLII